MLDEREPGRDAEKPWGGVVLIVAVGVALGLGSNALGLAGRPARGLPWIARPQTTTSVESLQPPAANGAGAGTMSAPGPAQAAVPDSATARAMTATTDPPLARATDAAPTRAAVATPPRGTTAGGAPAPAAPPPPPMAEAPASPATPPPAPATELPVIPDVSGPLTVGLPAFKRLYDAGAVLVVDAREPATFELGHIAGAISLPYNDALADPARVKQLDAGARPIVVYCDGGTCELSMDLAKVLVGSGKRRVLVYEGGYEEWLGAGHAVERGPGAGARP